MFSFPYTRIDICYHLSITSYHSDTQAIVSYNLSMLSQSHLFLYQCILYLKRRIFLFVELCKIVLKFILFQGNLNKDWIKYFQFVFTKQMNRKKYTFMLVIHLSLHHKSFLATFVSYKFFSFDLQLAFIKWMILRLILFTSFWNIGLKNTKNKRKKN